MFPWKPPNFVILSAAHKQGFPGYYRILIMWPWPRPFVWSSWTIVGTLTSRPFLSLLPPIYKAHVQASQLFQGCNILLVTFGVKNIVSFFIKKLLHFALKSCYILRQKLSHFWLMLHFVSKVVTIRVNVTFCVNCYILRRNTSPQFLSPEVIKSNL